MPRVTRARGYTCSHSLESVEARDGPRHLPEGGVRDLRIAMFVHAPQHDISSSKKDTITLTLCIEHDRIFSLLARDTDSDFVC